MIGPEQIAEIRRLFFAEHWKVGTIASSLDIHPDTVRRAVQTDRFNRPQFLRAAALTDPYVEFIGPLGGSSSEIAKPWRSPCPTSPSLSRST